MARTRQILEGLTANIEESMGVRAPDDRPPPRLSPVPRPQDAGRRALRNVGTVAVDSVVPDPDQPRAEFSDEAIERLAQSIRDKGQLSAIRVRWSEGLGKWVIIAGERRWRATVRAGLPTIDCYFHEGELSRSEVLEQQLIENCLREDLQAIEEARAFSTLMGLNGWNGRQVADALRVQPAKVSRALALLRLPPDIQEQVAEGRIPARSAYEISKLPGDDAQRDLAARIAAGRLTNEDAARAVRRRKGKSKRQGGGVRQAFSAEGGWKVVVSAPRKGGYTEIEQTLVSVLEEVRHRIANNVQIF